MFIFFTHHQSAVLHDSKSFMLIAYVVIMYMITTISLFVKWLAFSRDFCIMNRHLFIYIMVRLYLQSTLLLTCFYLSCHTRIESIISFDYYAVDLVGARIHLCLNKFSTKSSKRTFYYMMTILPFMSYCPVPT